MKDTKNPDILSVKRYFDADFYLEEYPDVGAYNVEPLIHFCRIGWKEGRNPNPFFDTTSYLISYPDIVRAKINPYFHFLEYGRYEGRQISPSFTPSVRSRLVFGHAIQDWVSLLLPKVDVDFYLDNLSPDLRQRVNPIAHFAYRGWREGLSPSERFDISELNDEFSDCAAMMVNPMIAQIALSEGRYRPARLLSRAEFELENLAVGMATPRERLSALGSGTQINETVPDVDALDALELGNALSDKPLTIEIEARGEASAVTVDKAACAVPALSEVPIPSEVGDGSGDNQAQAEAEELQVIRAGISNEYYNAKYPDVAAAGTEPAVHYYYTGWLEGRNPNRDFDTTYYLQVNSDVHDAGINPFWHYLVAGKAEGRPGRRTGGYLRQVLDSAAPPKLQKMPYSKKFSPLTRGSFSRLRETVQGADKLVVSISHDCYARVVGGTQIFLADEEANFRAQGAVYLHLSPLYPQAKLIEQADEFAVIVTCQGQVLGWSTIARVNEALAGAQSGKGAQRQLTVHCALGWSAGGIVQLAEALRPTKCLFWLHDYSSICVGYNLLRNDISFCGAPPPSSMACRVCVYGQERDWHLQQMSHLFSAVSFDVVAPSHIALEIWTSNSTLPYKSAHVHPHWVIEPDQKRKLTARVGKLRLGFIGYPTASKGWHHFVELATDHAARQIYDFYQFSTPTAEHLPEARFVPTEVMPTDRFGAVRILDNNRIDAVLVLSPWPETFSFVLFEALAAGCQVLCLSNSGNVASYVNQNKCGKVFESISDMRAFLVGEGASWLKRARKAAKPFKIHPTGTSATLTIGKRSAR